MFRGRKTEADGQHFLALEFVQGQTLHSLQEEFGTVPEELGVRHDNVDNTRNLLPPVIRKTARSLKRLTETCA